MVSNPSLLFIFYPEEGFSSTRIWVKQYAPEPPERLETVIKAWSNIETGSVLFKDTAILSLKNQVTVWLQMSHAGLDTKVLEVVRDYESHDKKMKKYQFDCSEITGGTSLQRCVLSCIDCWCSGTAFLDS
ncbi:hypothetical protein NEOLI_004626 [Neolecta irregularis DAH-3]|uniref:Uncharacterized protein n=1 Tax=Neolecta irregularis (strain DAH-3) TaxID=1198029 RepID=A0A1U7LGU1_NEOID|nr:hypothetical protein NEOLI_004626 [Neolecta irregularis DAH-3]|eukprot:OLL21876.1 hypothetical protein NEOLI_004626 [Neolecta irregularis DAH-3]